ncbi:MAG: DUF222 domain-containing protein, partial [Acidimicrobiia bacterium]
VDAFERDGLWETDGATSMVGWLRDRAGIDRRDTARLRATARTLARLPVVAAAAVDGSLSGGQVQAVVRAVPDGAVDVMASQEAGLVPTLAGLTLADTVTVLQAWRARVDADGTDPGVEPVRSLQLSQTIDNRWEASFSLDPEAGAVVDTALRLAATRDLDGEPPRTAAERRADALVDVCRSFLDHQHTKRGGRHRPHLNVIVDTDRDGHPRSAQVVDGPALPARSLDRLVCDCTLHRVVLGADSTILDLGRATRTIPAPLWNGLVIRDRHCRYPGCDRPPHWCDGHHLQPWEHGGETRPDNLVLLCVRHHHHLHKPGWHAKLLPDLTFEVTAPDGTHHTSPAPRTLTRGGDPDGGPPDRGPP